MKKIFLILIAFVLAANISFGQSRRVSTTVKWFSLAAKAGVGNSLFINSALMNDNNVNLNYFTLSHSFGGRFTFTYGDNLGFGADLLFSSYGQEYAILANENTYDKTITMKTMDIVPFFRYTGNNGVYAEIGAKISNISSVTESNSNSSLVFTERDLNTYYESKFNSAMFGFGMGVFRTDRLDVNIGLRATYSFTDILPDRSFNVVNDGVYVPEYVMDKSTNPLAVQAILEVNYFFAFWGDASCGRGKFMLFK